VWIARSTASVRTPTAIALGNFDGLHRGHQQVLHPITSARAAPDSCCEPQPGASRPYATVVSFEPHPQAFFTGRRIPLLTPLAEQVAMLEQLGIEQLVLLPFDAELAALSPQQFVEQILLAQLQATQIGVGENFRFGRNRSGTATQLQAIAERAGVTVSIASLAATGSERISSSRIRRALAAGELEQAHRLLGYPYRLTGPVVAGEQRGRSIGFPTANLAVPADKVLPRYGVYYVRLSGADLPEDAPRDGVMNVGERPTVSGTAPTVEVHLLEWRGELYGRTLTAELAAFLRPERSFDSLEALKAQIAADCEAAKSRARAAHPA